MTLEPQKLDDLINRKSIRNALRKYHDLSGLGQSPLAQLKIVASQREASAYADTPKGYGLALRQVLKEAIETLKPSETEPDNLTRPWRRYFILTQRFIDRRSREYIQDRLGIGPGMFFLEQRRAWDALADTLYVWEKEQNAADEGHNGRPKEPPVSLLPDRPYRQLHGREVGINQIIEALQDSDGRSMVGIDGMGGIGKTALAYEVTQRCLEEDNFEGAVWISASRGPSTSSGTVASSEQASRGLTFESVLDTIGQELGVPDIAKLKLAQKKARVQALLARVRTLVVLDNLETAYEHQNEIARQLQPLLASSRSKALLTSRYRFRGNLCVIHLSGLDESSVLPLIQQIAEEKGISDRATATLTPEDVALITEKSGGSPLALRLVVSLLDYLPLDIVLEHLEKVKPIDPDGPQDQNIDFYKFIFWRSWNLLTEESKQLLISMGHFAPGTGGDFKAIMGISGLPQALFTSSIDKLWRLSFLEVGHLPTLKEKRYYLHALTQHFVLADIVQIL